MVEQVIVCGGDKIMTSYLTAHFVIHVHSLKFSLCLYFNYSLWLLLLATSHVNYTTPIYNIVFISGDLEVKTVDPFAEQSDVFLHSSSHPLFSNLAISLSTCTCMLVG